MPKIIHQIWSGIDHCLPEHYKMWGETWKRDYPDWEYILWDNDRMDQFIFERYPQYQNIYKKFPYNIQRWDAIRYLILYAMGGMYVDFDYESLKPMTKLLQGKNCCFALEPKRQYHFFNRHIMFNNALMFSMPEHPFMWQIINTVFSQKSINYQPHPLNDCVMNTTGPWMLIDLYEQLSDAEKADIYLIPSEYVTPLDGAQAAQLRKGYPKECYRFDMIEAYAIHYFYSEWRNNNGIVNLI